jgi:hypothetical protein
MGGGSSVEKVSVWNNIHTPGRHTPRSNRKPFDASFVMRLIGPKAVEIAVGSYLDIL